MTKPRFVHYSGVFALLIALSGMCLAGCSRGDGSQEDPSHPSKPGLAIDEDKLAQGIAAWFAAVQDTGSGTGTLRLVKRFYAERGNAPRWVTGDSGAANTALLLATLGDASSHGLPPELYHVAKLRDLYAALRQALVFGEDPDYAKIAALEAGLSTAIVDYAKHLRNGYLDPAQLDPNCGYKLSKPTNDALLAPLHAADITAWLGQLPPAAPEYRRLQLALQFYESLDSAGGWRTISLPESKIEPGRQNAAIGAIARRLLATSQRRWVEFCRRRSVNITTQGADTAINWMRVAANVYDASLTPLVKEFQRLNGMLEDGVITRNMVDKMNISAAERARQIRVNLDRLRWFAMPAGKHVVVNIPDFRVFAYNGATMVHSIKICCGQTILQTPLLIDAIKFVVLNPPWNVPPSISKKETMKLALKNPDKLSKQGYRVLENGKSLDPKEIDWKTRSLSKPATFVQLPGGANALGKIKFLFPNSFDVYLHDTPVRGPFRQAVRAVSHGCMRVEEPMKLFDFVMNGSAEWTVEKAQTYLRDSRATKWITLEKGVPVYVVYNTAWVSDAGEIQLRLDIYGKDKMMKARYAAEGRGN